MRANKLNERDSVLEIINTGLLKVGKDNLDISVSLELNNGKEYRDSDINKINIKDKECKEPCKTYILACGSGDIPFEEEFKNNKVCILNFASSKHPGGGFMTGAHAQEENLCYHSNLYDALSKHNRFYDYNRNHLNNGLYTEGIIFTQNILFFRQKFENVKPKLADVITCAAPNKGAALRNGVKGVEVDKVMSARLEKILKVAIDNNVETLVLGAFGCGVFKNDIEYVANEIKKLLYMKGYAKYFKNIVIPGMKKTDRVYETFSRTFRGAPNLISK